MSAPASPGNDIRAIDPHDAARQHWDSVVVGAGPAGCAAAWHLANRGRRVLLVERARPPRDKICGDGLISDSLRALGAMGLIDQVRRAGHAVDRVRIYSPARIVFDLPGDFLTLRRRELDTILLRAAIERGAELTIGAAAAVEQDAERAAVRLSNGACVAAEYVVVATGADVSLLRKGPEGRPSAVALRTYVHAPDAGIDSLVVSFDRSILPGYAWIFPVADGYYNVGCGVFYRDDGVKPSVNLRELLRVFLREFPPARRLGVDELPHLDGARLRCGLAGAARVHDRRVVAVGEAIGTTFSFTGEGIGKAMETGALAAEHLAAALDGDASALGRLRGRIERELAPRYLGYDVAQRWLAHAWLADLLARRVRRSSRLRDRVTGILNETVDPRTVFSLRGLVPALLR